MSRIGYIDLLQNEKRYGDVKHFNRKHTVPSLKFEMGMLLWVIS